MIYYMIIIRILIGFCLLLIVPFVLGNGILLYLDTKYSFKMGYAIGWMLILSLFLLISLPATFLKLSLTALVLIYSAILGVIFLFLLIYSIKNKNKFRFKWKRSWFNGYGILAFLLLGVQIVLSIVCVHSDADDAYYLGTAMTSLTTDTLYLVQPDTGFLYTVFPYRYVFSSLMVFWSYVSKITTIHPLIIAHTIIPPIFILIAYILWWEIGKYLFKDHEMRCVYFLLLNVFNIFGNTSVYTQSSFLLFRIWQGKAMIANMIIPLLLVLFLGINRHREEWKRWGLVFVTVLAGCCCSSMAVPLCTICVMVASMVLAVFSKNWKMLLGGFVSCIPCFVIGIVYLLV